MKITVNLITISRFFGAVSLLYIAHMTSVYAVYILYAVYAACIVSDIADGWLARKFKVTTNYGAILDSSADLVLIGVVLVVFIFLLPHLLPLQAWMLYLVGLVLATRAVALSIGYYKYKTMTLLHTYANKGAGLVMACFPFFFALFYPSIAFLIIFAAAFLSALEELVITIKSKELDRNVVSMFNAGE
jgi:CDP-diacylglycerol--glycerol-3-phosphate 3-phosphatidyltransferase